MEKESLLEKLVFWFKNNKFFSIIIFLAIVVIASANVLDSIKSIIASAYTSASVEKPNPGFASVMFAFGNEGIGPGFFTEPWAIAIDGKGRIYVGELEGRVQVFDSTGKFISQWNTNDSTDQIRAIAASRQGTVYAVKGNAIYRYEGETGKLLGKVQYSRQELGTGKTGKDVTRSFTFSDVNTTVGGGLVASGYDSDDRSDDIILFDPKDKAILTIHNALRDHSYEGPLHPQEATSCDHIAVDGLGNIYAIEQYGHAVYKFSSDGRFLNHFGKNGLRMTVAIAVDGKGRVYVSEQATAIWVFDSDGGYISTFNASARGMVFNDRNELFVVNNYQHRVEKYILGENQ